MTPNEILVLFALGFACVLWWLISSGFPEYQLDKYRQRLFDIRDDLFVYALERDLLAADGYRFTRQTLNGQIRFAHRPSILGLMVFANMGLFSKSDDATVVYLNRLRESLHELPDEAKVTVRDVHKRMHVQFAIYMIKSSWLLGPLSIFVAMILAGLNRLTSILEALLSDPRSKRNLHRIDAEANEVGRELGEIPDPVGAA